MFPLCMCSKIMSDKEFFQVAEEAVRIGYKGLEVFGIPEHLPADVSDQRVVEFKGLCDGLDLKIVYVGDFEALDDPDGAIDYLPILKKLKTAGYKGFISTECHREPDEKMPSGDIAAYEFRRLTSAAAALGVGVAESILGAMIMMGKRLKEQVISVDSGGWLAKQGNKDIEMFQAKVG